MARAGPSADGLRIALFSGNYNCVRDGANKALNRLSAYLIERGAKVRIYSPTVEHPAFPPAGELVSVPSLPIPRRPEYRIALGLNRALKEDIRRFSPTVFHLSCPDRLGGQALLFARELGLPVVTSVHTRFETYLRYYGLGFLNPLVERRLRSFYGRSDYVLAPNDGMAAELKAKGYARQPRVWSRGVDGSLFNPGRRSIDWRRRNGFAGQEPVVLFFGRLVREKGLGTFEEVIGELRQRGHKVRPLVIGEGPERSPMSERLGDSLFTGHLEGERLAQAVASADILINPSVTEAFGNVNLEAMASGLAVVSADVPSARALIRNEANGLLVSPRDPHAYADAAERLMTRPAERNMLALSAVVASAAYNWNDILGSVLDLYLSIA